MKICFHFKFFIITIIEGTIMPVKKLRGEAELASDTIDYLNYATGIGIMKYCILCGVATTRDLCINYCATSLPV